MRAVLTYHSLDESGSPISVDPVVFREHMAWLAGGRVRVRSLTDLLDAPGEGDEVAVTFDDGFENFRLVALPLLQQYQLPATVFVVSGRVGASNAWEGTGTAAGIPELPLMDWDGLAEAAESGVSLGGHTVSHPPLPGLSPEMIEQEVVGCSRTIQDRTGILPSAFAYPYGRYSDDSVAVVGKHYKVACTTELSPLGPGLDPLMVPRLDMYYLRQSGQLDAWGTAQFGALIWARRQGRKLRRLMSRVVG